MFNKLLTFDYLKKYQAQLSSLVKMDEENRILLEESEREITLSKKIEEETKKAVSLVGNDRRYQVYLIVFFTLCSFLVMYQLIGPSYYFMNPIFQCNGVTTSEEEACQKLEQCVLVNDYTITASNKLYCGDKTGQRNLIQSMLGYGSFIGIIIVNFLSDYKGRRFSLLVALVVLIVSMALLIIGALYELTPLLIISQMFCGFSTISMLSVIYVLSDKLMSKKMMNITVLVANAFSSLSQVSVLLFTDPFNWKDLAIFLVLIPSVLLLLIGFWLLIEDPSFLFTKHLYQQSYASIRKIANINHTQEKLDEAISIMKNMEKKGLEIPSEASKSFKESFKYLKLLMSRQIIIPIISLGLNSFGGNVIYYALNFSASNTGNSYGTNMCLFGIAEFLSYFPLLYLGTRIPRKKSMYFVAILIIVLCLAFFLDLNTILQSVLIFAIRFLMCQSYVLYIYLQVQTFPQHIQTTAMGFVQTIGQPAKIVAPYFVQIADDHSVSPIGVMSTVALLFMILTFLPVKETFQKKKHQNESQTLRESIISQQDSSGNEINTD